VHDSFYCSSDGDASLEHFLLACYSAYCCNCAFPLMGGNDSGYGGCEHSFDGESHCYQLCKNKLQNRLILATGKSIIIK